MKGVGRSLAMEALYRLECHFLLQPSHFSDLNLVILNLYLSELRLSRKEFSTLARVKHRKIKVSYTHLFMTKKKRYKTLIKLKVYTTV